MSEVVLTALRRHSTRVALRCEGRELRFGALDAWSTALADMLAGQTTVGILAPSSFEFAAALCASWKAGAIAVPLQPQHPLGELEYIASDARLSAIFVHPACRELAEKLRAAAGGSIALLEIGDTPATALSERAAPLPTTERGALMIYTSGTTSRPKGAVLTAANLDFQITTLLGAWGWRESDRVVNVLPLHHVHGLTNILCCALAAGACCELYARFDASDVWRRLASGEVTVFMAVPTIYTKLAHAWDALAASERERLSAAAAGLRLMVSGSAALPLPLLKSGARSPVIACSNATA